jgi:hypothetical protein
LFLSGARPYQHYGYHKQKHANLCTEDIFSAASFAASLPAGPKPDLRMIKYARSSMMVETSFHNTSPRLIVCWTMFLEHQTHTHTFDTTMDQTTLPHRVVRSAKDLASATLSGTTFELKSPSESKHTGTSAQASSSFKHLPRRSAQSSARINNRGSSFRSAANDTLRKDAEDEFERFQGLEDLQAEYTACLASLHDKVAPQEGLYDPQEFLRPQANLVSNAVVEGAETNMMDLDEPTSGYEMSSESIRQRSVDFARTAASRRLKQIGAHLQRNLTMQTLQQDAYIQSHALVSATRSLILEEHTRQADDEYRRAIHSTQTGTNQRGVHRDLASQNRDAVAHVDCPPRLSLENQDNILQRQFHCPYYACHHNLQHLSTSSSSSSQRRCVHAGCDLNMETLNSWAEHIHTPHHDLLGSL